MQDVKPYSEALEKTLGDLWVNVLGRQAEPVDLDKPFLEYGAASLHLTRFVYGIKRYLGLELSVNDVLQCKSLKGLEAFCRSKLSITAKGAGAQSSQEEQEFPPSEDYRLRGMEVPYMQMSKRKSGVTVLFMIVKNSRLTLTDEILQRSLRTLQKQNPYLSSFIREKNHWEWYYVPTEKRLRYIGNGMRIIPAAGDSEREKAIEKLVIEEAALAPRWVPGEEPPFALVKYHCEGDSLDLGLCFTLTHAIADATVLSWINDLFKFCSDELNHRPPSVKRHTLPTVITDLIEWKPKRSVLEKIRLGIRLRFFSPRIGTPSQPWPRTLLYKRFVLDPSVVEEISKRTARAGMTTYSYICAAAVGAFALQYKKNKKSSASLYHSIDLFPFSKYQREQVKCFSNAIGSIIHFVDIVGGDSGDLLGNARKIGNDIASKIEKKQYVDDALSLIENGWMYNSNYLDRSWGHETVMSIDLSHVEKIPHLGEGTPWEVQELAWAFTNNILGPNLAIGTGYTHKKELVVNIRSNTSKMKDSELQLFATNMEALMRNPTVYTKI